MPITDKEKRRMEKLVNKQKYVDKDFPLSSGEKNLKWKRPHFQEINSYWLIELTEAENVEVGDSTVRLLRIRNPWGDIQDTMEWKGAFSDDDPKWTGVDAETRKKLEYVKDEDGQFFMKVSHFKRHFTHFWMAYKSPNFGDYYETTSQQVGNKETKYDSNIKIYNFSNVWDKGIVVKGEGVEYADNFLRNPLYTLTVEENVEEEESEYEIDLDEETVDESDDEDATTPSYNVIIQLIQDQNRGKYHTEIYPIGISVFQTGGRYPKELGPENLEEFEPHKGSVEPVVHGSIVARLNLRPGKYIVVPWVKEARMSRPFLMRVYALQRITMEVVMREE
ncbi:Calpain-A [Gryllus bimaculatus]|nr:Calpain-A [Gryllus bimaculatus]